MIGCDDRCLNYAVSTLAARHRNHRAEDSEKSGLSFDKTDHGLLFHDDGTYYMASDGDDDTGLRYEETE